MKIKNKVGRPKHNPTIKDMLEKLPEPFRTQALINSGSTACEKLKGKTIKNALMSAFVWSKSPEGGDYWKEFSDNNLI